MSSGFRTLLVFLLWVTVLADAGRPAAADVEGTPTVIDGDTIILQGETIRLHGIDAPELGQACWLRGQLYDCGKVARTALLDLTAGTPVVCQEIGRVSEDHAGEGRPGRCLAAGYDLSEGMAYTGWALAERAVTDRYIRFEEGARQNGRGLWKGRFVTPWDWRDGKRLPEETAAD